MGVVSEHGIQHWTVVLPFAVLCEVQLDQGLPIKFLSSAGIRPILLKPGNNVQQVKDDTFWGADWVDKRLERETAVVKR